MSQPTTSPTTTSGPSSDAGAARPDPRFPWKTKGTRKPLSLWDRGKFLLLIALLFHLLVWNEYVRFGPPETWWDAEAQVAYNQQWLLWLAGLEVLRQIHFLVSEHSARYHGFWSRRVFGATNRWWERRFNPWNRYRIMRVVRWLFWLAVLAVVLGRITDAPPVVALFKAPAMLKQIAPTLFYVVFLIFISVIQFAAIFWFMSKGGVDTIFPDDIETRFSDVWGQDHVLERVKENVVLLENPEAIEARGGHVPGGILLYGPPGTGKTLMAQAVAGETGKPFVFVEPGAFTAMFFGVGILKVKALFRRARKLALRYGGVILFFDEADTLGSRGARTGTQPGTVMTPWADSCHAPAYLSGHALAAVQGAAASALPPPEDTRWTRMGRAVDRFIAGSAMGGGSSSFDGTLQALLTELSGLEKPRGFFNKYLRRTLGMRPKPPPKYRILLMMASNLPEALDPALLRPGRLDRHYRVGYPSKAGRVRTYEGYLAKVKHELTPEQIERLAIMTPYHSGAKIKDTVNEALIYAIREDREVITWKDIVKARQLKELGPPEDVEYIERERHAVAVHEACHAVLAWLTRRHMEIDLATIEKGSSYLGMVSSIPPEDQFTQWRTEYESDIMVSLASLAGERHFYGGDNSSGVSGDLTTATTIAGLMESHWGMGTGLSSLPALQNLGITGGVPEPKRRGGIGFGLPLPSKGDQGTGGALGQRIEQNLNRLLQRAEDLLQESRLQVLALAHALETHKTLSGEDVVAVLEGRVGPLVDGRPYRDPEFLRELESYHDAAVEAHRGHARLAQPLPAAQPPEGVLAGEVVEPESESEPVPAGASAGEWAVLDPEANGRGAAGSGD